MMYSYRRLFTRRI